MIRLEVFLAGSIAHFMFQVETAHAAMGRQCLPAHDFMNLVRTAWAGILSVRSPPYHRVCEN